MAAPALRLFSGSLDEWDEYLESIYECYLNEIARAGLQLDGLVIRVRRDPASHGKDYRFWHLIQEGSTEDTRTPDLRRCERISWIAWMIGLAAAGDPSVLRWENERSTPRGRVRSILLWNPDHEYAVVIEKRANYLLLTTAYCVAPHRTRSLREEYNRWVAAHAPPAKGGGGP